MKTISFAQMKGGTGKTTVAYNVACTLAEKYKVLVLDFDPQCNMSSNFCFDIFDKNVDSTADFFEDISRDPTTIYVPAPFENLPNLDLMPSTMYLSATELSLFMTPNHEQLMKLYMKKNASFFNYYDYIIFDTSPSMGLINQNAFLVSDHIVLVLDPDCNSARGANVFLNLWDSAREFFELPDNVDALVINNVERTNISTKTLDYISEDDRLSKMLFETTIPHTTRFKECADQNVPIRFLSVKKRDEDSRLRAEKSIVDLINEMQERGVL